MLSNQVAYDVIKNDNLAHLNHYLSYDFVPEKIVVTFEDPVFKCPDYPLMTLAASLGRRTQVLALLGANSKFNLNACSSAIDSLPLLGAIAANYTDIADDLIAAGANVVDAYRKILIAVSAPDNSTKEYQFNLNQAVNIFKKLEATGKFYSKRQEALTKLVITNGMIFQYFTNQSYIKNVPEPVRLELFKDLFGNIMECIASDSSANFTKPEMPAKSHFYQKLLQAYYFVFAPHPDYSQAHTLLAELVTAGQPSYGMVEYLQAYCFQMGKGKPQNYLRALELYKKALAAAQHDKFTMSFLTIRIANNLTQMSRNIEVADHELVAIANVDMLASTNPQEGLKIIEFILNHPDPRAIKPELKNDIRALGAKCEYNLNNKESALNYIRSCTGPLSSVFCKNMFDEALEKLKANRYSEFEQYAIELSQLGYGPAKLKLAWFELNCRESTDYLAAIRWCNLAATCNLDPDFEGAMQALYLIENEVDQTATIKQTAQKAQVNLILYVIQNKQFKQCEKEVKLLEALLTRTNCPEALVAKMLCLRNGLLKPYAIIGFFADKTAQMNQLFSQLLQTEQNNLLVQTEYFNFLRQQPAKPLALLEAAASVLSLLGTQVYNPDTLRQNARDVLMSFANETPSDDADADKANFAVLALIKADALLPVSERTKFVDLFRSITRREFIEKMMADTACLPDALKRFSVTPPAEVQVAASSSSCSSSDVTYPNLNAKTVTRVEGASGFQHSQVTRDNKQVYPGIVLGPQTTRQGRAFSF